MSMEVVSADDVLSLDSSIEFEESEGVRGSLASGIGVAEVDSGVVGWSLGRIKK